tara:strand:+ start:112 stop:627 length:516 start_codon:yes stop_codon:yes gene_type:complete
MLTASQREWCELLGLSEQLVAEAAAVPFDEAFDKSSKKDDKGKDKSDKKQSDTSDDVKGKKIGQSDSKDDKKKPFGKGASDDKEKPAGKKFPPAKGDDENADGQPPQGGRPSFSQFGQPQVDPNAETTEEKKAKKAAKLQAKAIKDVSADLRKRLNTKPDTVTFYPSTERP